MSPQLTASTTEVIEALKRTVPPPRTRAQAEGRVEVPPPAPAAPAPLTASTHVRVQVPRKERAGERRRCSFDLPVELADRFRVACAVQGVQMRDVAHALIDAWVSAQQRG